jgi:uncharacterized protein
VADGVLVGRVAAVLRYPVKSMAAEPVEDVDVSWHGLSGDRRWAFVRPHLPSNGFPWLTLRQRNDLNDYHPCWTEPERPDASAVIVHTPAGARFDVIASALAAELGEVRVMKLNRETRPPGRTTRGEFGASTRRLARRVYRRLCRSILEQRAAP